MSNTNSYIAEQAAILEGPIAFAASNVPATTRANIDLALALIATEGTDASTKRLFLDEMSPAARTSVYRLLLDLKAAAID